MPDHIHAVLVYVTSAEDARDYYASLLPVGLLTIARFLEQSELPVSVLNCAGASAAKAADRIMTEKPGIIGLSVYTHNAAAVHALLRELSRRQITVPVVLGGPHAGFLADEYLRRFPVVKTVIQGEGEIAFRDIITRLESGGTLDAVMQCARLPEAAMPVPGRFSGPMHGVNPHEQFKYLVTSRGCSYACTYCSSPAFWLRRVSFRSVDSIIDEILFLKSRYGIIYFGIRDDNFTLRKQRVMQFADALIQSGAGIMWNCQSRVDTIDAEMIAAMKRAGLEHIQYGVESGSARILARYDKRTDPERIAAAADAARRVGVLLSIYLMYGMEGETDDDIRDTLRLMRRIRAHDCIVSPVAYYPGTALFEEARAAGKISDADWFPDTTGIYLRSDPASARFADRLLEEAERVGVSARYRPEDFAAHRRVVGNDWVADILEGDQCMQDDRFVEAALLYASAAAILPGSPWGHYKQGKALLAAGKSADAADALLRAAEAAPSFHLSRLYRAHALGAAGRYAEALADAEKAAALNPFERDAAKLAGVLRKTIRSQG